LDGSEPGSSFSVRRRDYYAAGELAFGLTTVLSLVYYGWRRLPRWVCVVLVPAFGLTAYLVQVMWETR
jgi:hypothetical protein